MGSMELALLEMENISQVLGSYLTSTSDGRGARTHDDRSRRSAETRFRLRLVIMHQRIAAHHRQTIIPPLSDLSSPTF
ncbi:hypothetical protein K443DRAFT_417143 [Laccaria amethystina LaAM-08-1]|uniref:Uncharacterized protein n=1 Tax=Laccaria amethystina LaAM-08-1 TaxID=1095629 RepID=A0A0C9XS17_9AGAR|nr:hypothetical protein K443DRAFT_417143 [Laccaria amethystina LaAM-08-1]